MKVRKGFVTNSSSTIYIIVNKTDKIKTLVDFVKENPQLVKQFKDEYDHTETRGSTQTNMLKCAEERGTEWSAHEIKTISFGDEDGDILGRVFDYILREGGNSESFSWRFKEWNR